MQVRVPLDMRELERVAMEVVVDDDVVELEQALDEMRSDETGASGDTYTLPRQSHVAS
jgi:hypothetical protein